MELYFYVDGLHVELVEKRWILNDNQNLYKAYFSFSGDIWTKGSVKTAIFHYNNDAYSVMLNDGCWCYVPVEVLRGEFFSVGVTTVFTEDGVDKCIYTDRYEIETSKSCYSDSVTNAQTTLSESQQLLLLIKQLDDSLNDYVTHSQLNEKLGDSDVSAIKRQVDANLAGILALMERMDRREIFDTQLGGEVNSIESELEAIKQRLSALEA